MRAEIIAVGTELLMGQIVNTNAQYLSRGLADIGVGVYFQTVVGDNAQRIKESLRIAKDRADVIICTGGLGPTQDDLTKDVLAETVCQRLVMHGPSMDKIEHMFQKRGVPMVESNARQALMLEHSEPLANDTGLAVGVALTHEGTHYILLPGPPKEMKPMFDRYAKPWIAAQMGSVQPLYSVMLKFAGIGESQLEHELIDLIEAQSDTTIAPYAKEGEVAIRLTTRAASMLEAQAKLKPLEEEIRSRVGQYIYAAEDIALEEAVLRLLTEQGRTLAVAESCTGGLLSDLLTNVPGSSAAFAGGIICYTNRLKHELLNVPMEQLEGSGAPGAVSEETAKRLAEQILSVTGSDYGVSVTGVAGPGESEGKPVGLVYVGVASRDGETTVKQLQQFGNRETIKLRSAKSALYQLWKRMNS
ncbi:competence/damage-inducible protein A [Paenibacillus allorhizosphaerae]|uniref:Putative competence-damage inducible protein n=1 Tax=Paenibacillus allorhizosphaerae TaxID=2849866 RepID=A0ABN7TET6_9BACL|nr:competence/damage-inducible protein A [Paenibacillus allorhizosphaerae]CAG7624169.1 Putative competence-damage inducible protein [Paenibacillus allorhizosphaerae]